MRTRFRAVLRLPRMSSSALAVDAERVARLAELRRTVESALEGKPEVVELASIALLARGHLLIEDVPGVGKTTLARALAHGRRRRAAPRAVHERPAAERRARRLASTTSGRASSRFRQGPIFANVLLADEINRASPRTQSALLEAMNEGQVSIDGQTTAAAGPVLRHRHAEPAGLRRHLPAARVAARSLHDAASASATRRRRSRCACSSRPRSTACDRAEAVLDPQQLVALQREVDRRRDRPRARHVPAGAPRRDALHRRRSRSAPRRAPA